MNITIQGDVNSAEVFLQHTCSAVESLFNVSLFLFSWQLLEGEVLPPQHGFGVYTFPVVYRQNVYFCSGRDEREAFMQCPSRFLKQSSPKPVVPIKMAIIGPPKSGKTGCKYQRQVLR